MSKKPRNKSVAPAAAGAQKWEQELISAAFCDETWKASVVSVVANSAADLPHIETLVTAVNAGSRKLFTAVSKAQLIALVNELGNAKAKKPKEVPLFVEVCEACKEFVDKNEEIPLPLLAKLIKFKLLEVKDKDLKRRERELKGGGEKAGKKDKKGDKSPAKGKAGKKTPEPPAAKAGTKLRKRGEEDLDAKYIDDEPDDGPQHYVILTGLYHPHLATYIAETGIEQDCLIRVLREDYAEPPPPSPRPDEKPKDDKQLAAEAAALEQKIKLENELKTFWRDAPLLLKHAPETSKLHNIALLLYKVRRELNMHSDADANIKLQVGTTLFDDISCMIYQLLDVKRQWLNYLAHQKLIKVPILTTPSAAIEEQTEEEESAQPVAASPTKEMKGAEPEWWQKLTTDVDMRRYNELMAVIPAESTSVELVLHCMLEQVSESTKSAEQASGGAVSSATSSADNPIMEHLLQLSLKLMISEAERDQLRAEFGVTKQPEPVVNQPVLINYHDDATKRLKHLDKVGNDFVPLEAELAMLKKYPIMQLLNPECVSESVMKERAARLHELLHFLNNGAHSHAEIDHCLKQFVLECMDLTAVNADDQVMPLPVSHKQVDIPWDDPYPYFIHQIPQDTDCVKSDTEVHTIEDEIPTSASRQRKDSAGSNRSLMSVHFDKELQQSTAEHFDSLRLGSVSSSFRPVINNPQKRDLDQWCFTEHFDHNVLPQVLKKALDTHPFVDVYDHKRDGTRVLALHSALSDRLYNRQDWHTEIHSRVGFRHYLEYVSNLIGDWTIQEEAKYQAKLLAKEVEDSQKEFDDEKQKAQAADRKSRSKSPKKSPARGKSPGHSNDSSVERPKSGVVIRNGSLKAWKVEQDQLKAEQEAANEKKKRGRSPKEKEKEKEKEAHPSTSPGPPETRKEHRPSSLKRSGDTVIDTKDTDLFTFAGYDIASLVQSASTVSHMHPSDGGMITISTNNFIEGPASVHTTLSKDGHFFSVHVLEPQVPEERELAAEEASVKVGASLPHSDNTDTLPASTSHTDLTPNTGNESEPKVDTEAAVASEADGTNGTKVSDIKPPRDNKSPVGAFGSFVAQFADGLCVSVSAYGNTGRPLNGHKYEPQPYIPPVIAPVADKPAKEPTSARGRKTNKDNVDKTEKGEKDKSTERAESTAEKDETSSEISAAIEDKSRDAAHPSFQQLHVSCPDGLYVTFVPPTAYGGKCDKSEEATGALWVRQKYAIRSKGVNSCEVLRQQAMKEASRVVTCDGTVIKTMLDGTAEVLYADGKVVQYVFKSPLLTPTTPRVSSAVAVTASQTEAKKTTSTQGVHSKKDKSDKTEPEHVEEPVKKGFWITTLPSGERYATSEVDGSSVPVKCALISETCDPATKQRIRTREDKVMTVMHVDGSQIVEHVDGTRITRYFQKTRIHHCDEANKETGERSGTSTQMTQFTVVECPGYASVTYNNERPDCQVEFADRTVLHAQPDCSYHVEQADGGLLMIETDGTAVYFPCPDYTSPPRPSSEPHMQYIMRHFADDLLQTVDDDKNLFQVRADGFAGALLASSGHVDHAEEDSDEKIKQGDDRILAEDERLGNLDNKRGSTSVNSLDSNRKVVTYNKHAPRFFVVNGDGSGMEVMRYQDLYEPITAAEDDPTSAVLMDPLPDQPNILGISVLRPYTRTISHQWLLNYRQQSITPQGLVSRDWTSFPASEYKKPGPVFGTKVGRGVCVGAVPAPPPPPLALPRCPNMLEIRQVLQYLPSSKLRDSLKQCFYDYAQFTHNRDRQRSLMATEDPRSEDERLVAMDVTMNAAASAKAATADTETLLADGGGVIMTGAAVVDLSGSVKHRYETVTQMAAAPPPVLTPQPKRTRADWERIERELREAQENKVAIRDRNIPPYFESDMGKAFLRTQARDVSMLMDDLSKEEMLSSPKNGIHNDSDNAEHRVESSASVVRGESDQRVQGGRGSPGSDTHVPIQLSAKSAALIPVHDGDVQSSRASVTSQGEVKALLAVPAQTSDNSMNSGDSLSAQHSMALPASDSTTLAEDSTNFLLPPSSPYVSRPINPTPAHAILGTAIDNKGVSDYSLLSRVPMPRADVRIPVYLSSRRPNPQPNQKFQTVEEPVRRKVVNIGTVASSVMASEKVKSMRGFELLPPSVHFGTLKEGGTYQISVLMKNVGTDTCNFRIKQPPPSTGIKVLFTPGPVAAGLTTTLTIEIYAIAAGIEGAVGVAKISHSVTIVTETDILSLPVTATVITADEYNQIPRTNTKLSPRVKPVTAARPPPAGKLYTRSQNYKEISFDDVDL